MRMRNARLRQRAGQETAEERHDKASQAAPREEVMSLNRRTVLKGALATGVASQALRIPAAVAQAQPIRVGFLTIKTGPLASGGLQMEQGLTVFFKERNNSLAGR